jgi:Spy/CpxP family protein refolding chaperone
MSITSVRPSARLNRGLSALALAAALAGAGAAYAAAGDAPPPGAAHAGWQHRDAMMQRQLDKIHAQLKLNASQEQLWQAAIAAMHADHEQARALHQQARQQTQALLQAPILDPHALASQHDQIQAQMQQLRTHTETAWFALYDTLDDKQKAIASDAIKARLKHMHDHHKHMEHMAPASAAHS